MVSGWLITLGLVNAYIVLLVWLVRSGKMEKYNLSLLLGFILMVRSQRGRKLLATISRPRKFWNAFGDLGIVVTLVGMVAMTALFLAILPTVLNPKNNVPQIAASEILVIPGVNPIVPLWYGIIALIVTLAVHEGGHGILALANKMRLKSLGLLFAVVPIGAFVEPDEQDLTESPRRSRLRVYAAGPAVNFAVALLVLGAMAGVAGAAEPHEGVPILTVVVGAPSMDAGITPGDVLISADGTPLANWTAFSAFMATKSPQDSILFETRTGAERNATLTSRWDALSFDAGTTDWQEEILQETELGMAYCDAYVGPDNYAGGGECADALAQMTYLGIGQYDAAGAQSLFTDPFQSGGAFLQLTLLPISEVRGTPVLGTMPDFFDAPGNDQTFWISINVLFWIFWMNLMVGLTNILPMLPLDGGHLFRDSMGGVMEKIRPNATPESRDKLVGRIASAMSLIILVAFLLQIFGGRLVQALI